MANFSKYLGKEERVLNSIDMRDETVWSQNNVAAAEYKSWTTLALTNKRLFSLNKRKLHMREFRLEDVVSTGWTYHPQWGKIIWGFIYLIAAALIFIKANTIGSYLVQYGAVFGTFGAEAGSMLSRWVIYLAVVIGILAVISFISYFLLKRTTFTMTTKDGREYKFLLRGRRWQIDEFRMAVQDAKDLYLEETENRYFDKMRTVLFDQSNYEYALNNANAQGRIPAGASEPEKLKGEEYLLWERKTAGSVGAPEREQLGGGQTALPGAAMRLNADGTLQLEAGDDRRFESPSGLIEAPLAVKAADLFEQMGFEVSKLTAGDADMLLYKDNLRYIVVIDLDESGAITNSKIKKAIDAKNHYKTDFGLFISDGFMTDEIQNYANSDNVKIVSVRKAE